MDGNGWEWPRMAGNGREWPGLAGNGQECPNEIFPPWLSLIHMRANSYLWAVLVAFFGE
jgi:hypothetical protein